MLWRFTQEHNQAIYFWIDAICIDQTNDIEKGHQVALMDKIYSSAKLTIIWVGQEDEFTKDAMSVIDYIGKVPLERHNEIKPSDWHNQNSALKRIGSKPQDYRKWLGLIALLNRPYFSRIWIVQEILLSKIVLLVCGDFQIPWYLVGNTISFVITAGWLQHLTVLAFTELPLVMARPGPYRSMLEDRNLSLGLQAINLEVSRTGILRSGHLGVFRHLLEVFRASEANDPRDKIYALLGITWREKPPFLNYPDALVPDYTLTSQQLFTKTARLLLLGREDLRYLCHVEDRSLRKIEGLPSWVPDYTAPLWPRPFYLSSSNKEFAATKGLLKLESHVPSVFETSLDKEFSSPHLRVRGLRLSTLKALARFSDTISPKYSSHVFESSWSDIFGYVANISLCQISTLNP